MFKRWILTLSLFVLDISVVLTAEFNRLPKAETFNSHARFPEAAYDEDDKYILFVSRGKEVLTSTQTKTGHYREITLTLTAFREKFVLDLKLNTYLFASTYIEKAVTNSGDVYNEVNHVTGHCYYTGQVRGRSQSTAAVSTCKGITGYFAIGNVSYHIEPKGDHLNSRHRVLRDRDDVRTNSRCGTDRALKWMSNINSTESFRRSIHRMKRAFVYPQDADGVDKVVEVYVANDRSQYRARASDVNNVYRRTKDIVNVASLAYQQLGIYLVLVGVEVWTDSDRYSIIDTDVGGALSSWYTYRQSSVNPFYYNDNGVLLTNVAFYGGVVGKAIVGSMCSNQYSGSIISDLSSLPAAAGSTLAHEMGHNFGQQHDTTGCSCDDSFANNHCIMYPSTNSQRPSTKWSSCSKAQFVTSFNQGLDICLYNIPQTIFQSSSTCGNGIIEDGEQCDCGNAPSSECSKSCCSDTTCQLTGSASCASGRCCDISRCQIKSSGTECRAKSNDCDISESCNGADARCPTDSYKPDGTDCTNIDSAYCYKGLCQSHRSQCELLWGPGSLVSTDQCYSRFNTAGLHYGNCGHGWNATGNIYYLPCDSQDVKCGKLLCQDNSKSLYHYQTFYLLSSGSVGSDTCHSVIFDFGLAAQDPGLVPNGAKCGDRQMCVNQKCIATTLSPPATTSTTTSSTSTTRSTTSTTRSTTSTTTSTTSTTRTTTSTTTTPITTRSTTTTSTSTSPTTTSITTRPTSRPTSSTSISSTSISSTSISSTSKSSTSTSPTTTSITTRPTSRPTSSTSISSTSISSTSISSTSKSSASKSPTSPSSSLSTTTKASSSLPSSPTQWNLQTTISTFAATNDTNSTSAGGPGSGGLTGQKIGLIVGLVVGLIVGLLLLILLIVLGYRYRKNLRNLFDKKIRSRRRTMKVTEIDSAATTDNNNVFENHGYTTGETTSYNVLSPNRQVPLRSQYEGLSPMRQAPGPPNAVLSLTGFQKDHNSVYSDFSVDTWISEDETQDPPIMTVYDNQAGVFNGSAAYLPRPLSIFPQTPPKPETFNYGPAKADSLFPQPPPKPQTFNYGLAKAEGILPQPPAKPQTFNYGPVKEDTNVQVVRGPKPSQLPVKPYAPIVTQSKGQTLLPPGKQQNLLPTAPAKPQGKVGSSGTKTAKMPPPAVRFQGETIPPKPMPPTKPSTAVMNSNQTSSKSIVEASDVPTTLSVQELMNQFGETSRKPAVSARRPTPVLRKPPQSSNA